MMDILKNGAHYWKVDGRTIKQELKWMARILDEIILLNPKFYLQNILQVFILNQFYSVRRS